MVALETVSSDHLQKSKEYSAHKRVVRITDAESGLKGFVAIHNDLIGSAVGGTRMLPYASEDEALDDVLRLSRAMTYKCALAGVKHGGGKGVIIGNPHADKTEALLRAYARAIGQLGGAFNTGEDVGISEPDVHIMLEEAPFFIGKPGQAGDPSPYAALSTFYSIQTIATIVFGTEELKGRTVAVKGVGKVGGELVRLLLEKGAVVTIADVNDAAVTRLKNEHPGVSVVSPSLAHAQPVDIYSPCALGNEFTPQTMEEVKAKIICGAANNQLADDVVGDWFFEKGISYVPDYIANAGGLIDVVDELDPGGFKSERVIERINNIKNTIRTIFEFATLTNRSPNRVADNFAEDLFKV